MCVCTHVEIALAFIGHSEANNLTTKHSRDIKTVQVYVKDKKGGPRVFLVDDSSGILQEVQNQQ